MRQRASPQILSAVLNAAAPVRRQSAAVDAAVAVVVVVVVVVVALFARQMVRLCNRLRVHSQDSAMHFSPALADMAIRADIAMSNCASRYAMGDMS